MSCCERDCSASQADNRYRRILWAALAVNLAIFGIELVASIVAGSVSLRADALDFLADTANYAVALAVVGLALQWRARAALLKGGIMGLFGLWVTTSTVHHATAAIVNASPDLLLSSLSECRRMQPMWWATSNP